VLIDYPHTALSILAQAADAVPLIKRAASISAWRCAHMTATESRSSRTSISAAPQRRSASTPASNKGIALYHGALDLPGVRALLHREGARQPSTGARGDRHGEDLCPERGCRLRTVPPAAWPDRVAQCHRRLCRHALANIGNRIFAAMKLKMLLDYKARRMTFYGRLRALIGGAAAPSRRAYPLSVSCFACPSRGGRAETAHHRHAHEAAERSSLAPETAPRPPGRSRCRRGASGVTGRSSAPPSPNRALRWSHTRSGSRCASHAALLREAEDPDYRSRRTRCRSPTRKSRR